MPTVGRKDGVKSEKWEMSSIKKQDDFYSWDPMISTERYSYIERNLLSEAETFTGIRKGIRPNNKKGENKEESWQQGKTT